MKATDEFTAASAVYVNAIRHPHKSGGSFEWTGWRFPWRDLLALAVLVGFGWLALAVMAVASANVHGG